MKLLFPKRIITCNDDFDILEGWGICFDEKIIDIDTKDNLKQKYPNVEALEVDETLMPGLVNNHIHLEFSSNKSTLEYGDFISWLISVIEKREKLFADVNNEVMQQQTKIMLKAGITTFGQISSTGIDLEVCANAPQKVVFFNEILGSNPSAVDTVFADFKKRLEKSGKYKSDTLIPAISIHSPYSTHPILIKHTLKLAKEKNLVVSTHFLESKAERNWLESRKGDFAKFYDKFFPNAKPITNIEQFLEHFKNLHTIFVHCCDINKNELQLFNPTKHFISHCPTSNRLLNNPLLNLNEVKDFSLSTDGLSSNTSLSLWGEMRFALNAHFTQNLNNLAKKLLFASTNTAAKSLNLKTGQITKNYDADFILIQDDFELRDDYATQVILHTNEAEQVFINGLI